MTDPVIPPRNWCSKDQAEHAFDFDDDGLCGRCGMHITEWVDVLQESLIAAEQRVEELEREKKENPQWLEVANNRRAERDLAALKARLESAPRAKIVGHPVNCPPDCLIWQSPDFKTGDWMNCRVALVVVEEP